VKAAKFKVFVDLDMANSFHQIPLSPEFSDLLSVKTPWGLVRPKFLPEGVGPASGLLQHIVRDAFVGFEDWTIVIFDNFLILADDYDDAYAKLEKVLKRCSEFGIILKLKKSWMGVDKVTFFGYEVQHGTWQLSDTRKTAISAMEFPKNTKQMQSFLGAALFFHHHIPNYSEWTARLYEMTHDNFVWKPGVMHQTMRLEQSCTKKSPMVFISLLRFQANGSRHLLRTGTHTSAKPMPSTMQYLLSPITYVAKTLSWNQTTKTFSGSSPHRVQL
jgi:hypothetical protein